MVCELSVVYKLFSSDCGLIEIQNSTVFIPDGTTLGSNALIVCDDEYTLVGESFISCSEGPSWGELPYCVRGIYYRLLISTH